MPMATKPSRAVTYNEELPSIKSKDHLIMWSCICYISTTTMTMATKLGRVVLYNGELPSIKSQNLLITWSCKVT